MIMTSLFELFPRSHNGKVVTALRGASTSEHSWKQFERGQGTVKPGLRRFKERSEPMSVRTKIQLDMKKPPDEVGGEDRGVRRTGDGSFEASSCE